VIVGISVTILLFLFFLDWKLTVISLLPVFFALISTLGTMNLIGHPLDIPGLMLAIIVMGMGIDYSLFFVRSYQRYSDASHPSYSLIRMAVFMSSASTLIGFGVLCTAEHSLLRSAGLTSLLGIGYSLIGAFVILPPVLNHVFQSRQKEISQAAHLDDRILGRYRKMEAYPKIFARLKIRLDPMFSELPRFFGFSRQLRTIIDIGCGFGLPASWLIENFDELKIYGIDLDGNRRAGVHLRESDRMGDCPVPGHRLRTGWRGGGQVDRPRRRTADQARAWSCSRAAGREDVVALLTAQRRRRHMGDQPYMEDTPFLDGFQPCLGITYQERRRLFHSCGKRLDTQPCTAVGPEAQARPD
jgi:hypothetical protein